MATTGSERVSGIARQMSAAAKALLASLSAEQRAAATTSFDAPDHRVWTYLPGPRAGLALAEMTSDQQALALALLETGCSVDGARTARAIIELDKIRRELGGRVVEPGDHRFWVRILGEVSDGAPWAWRINGHHLAIHVTVVGDLIAVTPNFFGSEPAVVPHGPHQGLRTLPDEEELARALLASLDPAQRGVAIASEIAPHDILTRDDPVADPSVLLAGLTYAEMSHEQRELLQRLVRCYFDRAPLDHAAACWQQAVDAGLDAIRFSWAGSDTRGRGHYYAVAGPTFLLEYDNTQDDANHIHSVWRELRNDWGEDLLSAHYATGHR
jgi:hypothetical protein